MRTGLWLRRRLRLLNGTIERVELNDVSVRDYAAEQQMTANAAGVRLFRAREALKRRVIQSCGTCADHGCLDCRCSG